MKPWEEDWEAHPRAACGGSRLYSDGHEEEWATTWGADNDARARLASAAPDLARALLAVERAGYNGNDECCPACDGGAHGAHATDCMLDAALRKAGVR